MISTNRICIFLLLVIFCSHIGKGQSNILWKEGGLKFSLPDIPSILVNTTHDFEIEGAGYAIVAEKVVYLEQPNLANTLGEMAKDMQLLVVGKITDLDNVEGLWIKVIANDALEKVTTYLVVVRGNGYTVELALYCYTPLARTSTSVRVSFGLLI
ncbi:MAG: hypothetical protein JKX76_04195 [Colwellia sp.]|nr:hypothetical protein [Colwellia sp.]